MCVLLINRQEIVGKNRINSFITITNLYIKNLPESWTDEKMEEEFKVFGEILSHKVCTWNFFIQDKSECLNLAWISVVKFGLVKLVKF